jgi:hypothetical protein
MLEAGDEHGWNAKKALAALLFKEPDQEARVEVRHQHKGAHTRDRSEDRETTSDDVEQWHATYLNHALRVEGIDISPRAIDNATVVKDRPLRAPCGTGGVEDLCRRTRIDLGQGLSR